MYARVTSPVARAGVATNRSSEYYSRDQRCKRLQRATLQVAATGNGGCAGPTHYVHERLWDRHWTEDKVLGVTRQT